MLLEGILGTGYTSQTAATTPYRRQEEDIASLPHSWGNDSVSFSAEAMAAREADAAGNNDQAEEDVAGQFKSYMKKARGEEGDNAASPEEQIEKLKERLKKLTEQKAQIAQKEGSGEMGQSKMEALDAEINQVISQIAELEAQVAAAKTQSA